MRNGRRRAMTGCGCGQGLSQFLTLTALEAGTFTFTISAGLGDESSIAYSLDDGQTWRMWYNVPYREQAITTPVVAAGARVMWKGNAPLWRDSVFSSTGRFKASGNIMSLLYGVWADLDPVRYPLASQRSIGMDSAFRNMFRGSLVTEAPLLPATQITGHQTYQDMFHDCAYLERVPDLPAFEASGTDTCAYMFTGCSALVKAPKLPSTVFGNGVYKSMFEGCTSLRKVQGVLPARTLTEECYANMFRGCRQLRRAPLLPGLTLQWRSYAHMFDSCSELEYVCMLATDISADSCLSYWLDSVGGEGLFVRNMDARWDVRGAGGVPQGWMIIDN